jgi:hypothetical protein
VATANTTGVDLAQVDPDAPDHERFPLFANARLDLTRHEAGEMLFLPEGWFHHVRSLTNSVSINLWTVSSRRAA